jgi:hypothetical protein
MTDFVEALENELRRAAERKARGAGRPWRTWRPSHLLPVAAIAVALGIGLAIVLAVRPAGDEAGKPGRTAVTTPPKDRTRIAPAHGRAVPPAGSTPADVSPGARRSKRFGLGKRLAAIKGVPVFADVDRWRYCPGAPLPLRKADVTNAVAAVLAITGELTQLDTFGARAQGTLVTGTGYATHQCGSLMRNRSVDVGVVLPGVTNSASLSQLDLVVARAREGWVVFDRRH